MIEFIFMLTRDDVTLSDAREVYASIADTGVRHVGCKDVGLPTEELKALMDDIRSNGHETWIEVVSETEEDELASARAASMSSSGSVEKKARMRNIENGADPLM